MVGRSSGTVPKGGKLFFKRCEYFMGTTIDGDVPDRFDLDGRGTSIRIENEGTTGITTKGRVDR